MTEPEDWLEGRGTRRVEAVDHAYGILGLDYGKGHLDELYTTAYEHAYRDTWALALRKLREQYDWNLPGHLHLEYGVLYEKAQGKR